MDRDQPQPEHVLHHEEVPEIAAGIGGAGLAVALRVERLGRPLERGAADVDPAGRQPRGAVPAVPRGGDAVEQVHAARDSLEQIRRKSDSHKITGDLARQAGLEQLEHAVHHRLRLADREPADGDAGPGAALERPLERARAAGRRGCRPGRWARASAARRASPSSSACRARHRSSQRSVRSIPSRARSCDAWPGTTWSNAIAMSAPRAHWISIGALGRERARGAVHVALELDAVLRDPPQPLEREDLEAAGVGEHRAVPGGEAVQAAHARGPRPRPGGGADGRCCRG